MEFPDDKCLKAEKQIAAGSRRGAIYFTVGIKCPMIIKIHILVQLPLGFNIKARNYFKMRRMAQDETIKAEIFTTKHHHVHTY